MQLAATAAEREAGELSAATLEQVVARIRTDGYCVVDGIVPTTTLDRLRPQLDLQAAEQLLEGGGAAVAASDGFLSNGLPRAAPFVRPEIVCNSIIEQVKHASSPTPPDADPAAQVAVEVLGEAPFLSYCAGNSNLPGCGQRADPPAQILHMVLTPPPRPPSLSPWPRARRGG